MSELTTEALAELVRAALAGLGKTADQVAETLRTAGIVGAREDGCACPVALYLAREVPELKGEFGQFRWNVDRKGVSADTVWVLDHPVAVWQFITAFDLRDDYEDLAVTS